MYETPHSFDHIFRAGAGIHKEARRAWPFQNVDSVRQDGPLRSCRPGIVGSVGELYTES